MRLRTRWRPFAWHGRKVRVVLISFSPEVVRACRQIMPQYRVCWTSNLNGIATATTAERYLAEFQASGAQGLGLQADAPVTEEWLQRVRGEDGILAAWTVNEVTVARRMAALGVDFIITDRPGGLRREMSGK
ncbi:MAG: glycerophosphodiester phosphodiesterase family protein [Akkermansiaceae bacterium]